MPQAPYKQQQLKQLMAGVLNALASYVTKMLADMARDEVATLIGVSGQIDDLSVKLRDLNVTSPASHYSNLPLMKVMSS